MFLPVAGCRGCGSSLARGVISGTRAARGTITDRVRASARMFTECDSVPQGMARFGMLRPGHEGSVAYAQTPMYIWARHVPCTVRYTLVPRQGQHENSLDDSQLRVADLSNDTSHNGHCAPRNACLSPSHKTGAHARCHPQSHSCHPLLPTVKTHNAVHVSTPVQHPQSRASRSVITPSTWHRVCTQGSAATRPQQLQSRPRLPDHLQAPITPDIANTPVTSRACSSPAPSCLPDTAALLPTPLPNPQCTRLTPLTISSPRSTLGHHHPLPLPPPCTCPCINTYP